MTTFNVMANDFKRIAKGTLIKTEETINQKPTTSLYRVFDNSTNANIDSDIVTAKLPVVHIDTSKPTVDMYNGQTIDVNILTNHTQDIPEGGKLSIIG